MVRGAAPNPAAGGPAVPRPLAQDSLKPQLTQCKSELVRQNSELVTHSKELERKVKEQHRLLRPSRRNVEIQCSPRYTTTSTQHTPSLPTIATQCDPEELSHCHCDDTTTSSISQLKTQSEAQLNNQNLQSPDAQSKTMQKFMDQLNVLCDKLAHHPGEEEDKENNPGRKDTSPLKKSPLNVSVHKHGRDGVLIHPNVLPRERVFDIDYQFPDLVSIVDEIDGYEEPERLDKMCPDTSTTSMGFDELLTDLFFNQ